MINILYRIGDFFLITRKTVIKRRIFVGSLLIIFGVVLVGFVLQLWFFYDRYNAKSMETLEGYIEDISPVIAHASWRLNESNIKVQLQSILSDPNAVMVHFSDDFIDETLRENRMPNINWEDCDRIQEKSFIGYSVQGNLLSSGELQTCFVQTAKFKDIFYEFLRTQIALPVSILIAALAITALVNAIVLRPLQQLYNHLSNHKDIETFVRFPMWKNHKSDEIDEMISELKRRTRERNRERQVAEASFPEVNEAIVETDGNHRVLRSNMAFGRLIELEETFGKTLTDFFPQSVLENAGNKKEYKHDDGRSLQINTIAIQADRPEEAGYLHLITDLTQFKKEQEKQLHSSKLVALGTLSGGIAHDYNNLLAIILSNAELVSSRLPENSDERQHIEAVIQAASRGASLSNQLLAFARHKRLRREVVEASHVAETVFRIVEPVIGKSIRLKSLIESESMLEVDVGLLESALVNLVINAKDAMPNGGQLELCAIDVVIDSVPYISFSVKDTGIGIPENELRRVRDPFYTTKAQSKGTGMGLAIVSSFAEQFGGSLDIHSEVGVGTTVQLILPAHIASESCASISESIEKNKIDHAGKTILLVDDESALRKILASSLENAGFIVVTAGSIDEIKSAGLHHKKYDVVLCDVILSQHSVIDVFRLFNRVDNQSPFALMSGNVPEQVQVQLDKIGSNYLLMKPFRVAELIEYIENVIYETSGEERHEEEHAV